MILAAVFFCFFLPGSIRKTQRNSVVMALKRLGDIYHVHSDNSVIVIYCISVLLPLATGFYLNVAGLRLFLQSVGIFMQIQFNFCLSELDLKATCCSVMSKEISVLLL